MMQKKSEILRLKHVKIWQKKIIWRNSVFINKSWKSLKKSCKKLWKTMKKPWKPINLPCPFSRSKRIHLDCLPHNQRQPRFHWDSATEHPLFYEYCELTPKESNRIKPLFHPIHTAAEFKLNKQFFSAKWGLENSMKFGV